ncbi:12675_t:CDS:2, partial [Acaulospora colombiana]
RDRIRGEDSGTGIGYGLYNIHRSVQLLEISCNVEYSNATVFALDFLWKDDAQHSHNATGRALRQRNESLIMIACTHINKLESFSRLHDLNPPRSPTRKPRETGFESKLRKLGSAICGTGSRCLRLHDGGSEFGLPLSSSPNQLYEDLLAAPYALNQLEGEAYSPSKDSQTDGVIRCICATHWDDGQMVQCDSCQTWQHAKCYKVDFEQLKKDSAAAWICVVCDEAKWSAATLDSEWAKGMQKREEERERVAALARQIESQSRSAAGKKGRGVRRAINTVAASGGALASILNEGGRQSNDDRPEVKDEIDSWRRVYIPIARNIVDGDLSPTISRYNQSYGPKSRFLEAALETTKGWASSVSKGKGKEIADYDITSRSLPVVVSYDELKMAETESLLFVKASHQSDPGTSNPRAPSPLRSGSPSSSRPHPNISTHSPVVPIGANMQGSLSPSLEHPTASITRHGINPELPRSNEFRVSSSPPASRPLGPTNSAPINGFPGTQGTIPAQPDHNADLLHSVPGNAELNPIKDIYSAQMYSLHASEDTAARTLLALYPSNVISHPSYMASPANQYFHIGLPKPYVKILGAPLEVALDARV